MESFSEKTIGLKIVKERSEGPVIEEGLNFVFEQNPKLAVIGNKEQYSEYLKTIFPESKIKNIIYHGSRKVKKLLPFLNIKYGKKIEKFSEEDRNTHKKHRGYGRANDVGFYFSPKQEKKFKLSHKENAYWEGAGNYGDDIYPVVVNFKNPANTDYALGLTQEIQKELESLGYDSAIGTYDMMSAGVSREMQLIKGVANPEQIVEYIAFQPEQIHILGSEEDLEQFKNFIGNQN